MTERDNERIIQILERITRIEGKLDHLDTIEKNANEGYMIACQCRSDINEMKNSNKWAWRTIITTCIGVATSIILLIIGRGQA